MARVLLFNKPFQVLCQFTSDGGKSCLADYIDIPDIYAAGRLDYDSEGLLALTADGAMVHRITDPKHKLPKTYLVQVEGTLDASAIQQLHTGVMLKDGLTLPAHADIIDDSQLSQLQLWPRNPPIRQRKNIATTWISLQISEGKNRQVRRMCAAVGFPCLRLVRWSIGQWTVEGLQPGEYKWTDQL